MSDYRRDETDEQLRANAKWLADAVTAILGGEREDLEEAIANLPEDRVSELLAMAVAIISTHAYEHTTKQRIDFEDLGGFADTA